MENVIAGLLIHFQKLSIDFFMVGAQARDILAKEAKLPLSARATTDVDFGIMIDTWEDLEKLRESFKSDVDIKTSADENNKVRYYFQGTPFDLVPFGGIETNGKISWPPFYDTIMTVTGYKEALESAKKVKIGNSEVKVVIPEMLVSLKIISWGETYYTREKDAEDIGYILKNYEVIDPAALDSLYEKYEDIMIHFDYDLLFAPSAIVGIKISKISSKEHLDKIFSYLDNEGVGRKLAHHMSGRRSSEQTDEENFQIVNALLYGLRYQT